MDTLPHTTWPRGLSTLACLSLALTCGACQREALAGANEARVGFVSDPQAEWLPWAQVDPVPKPPVDERERAAEASEGIEPAVPEPAVTAPETVWMGRPASALRVRVYTRSGSQEVQDAAQALALKLESVGFAVELKSPERWREAKDSTWIGDRTIATLLDEETTNLVLLPPDCRSAAARLQVLLGPKFRFQERAAHSMQHEQEGDGVDSLIDVFPKRGVVKRL